MSRMPHECSISPIPKTLLMVAFILGGLFVALPLWPEDLPAFSIILASFTLVTWPIVVMVAFYERVHQRARLGRSFWLACWLSCLSFGLYLIVVTHGFQWPYDFIERVARLPLVLSLYFAWKNEREVRAAAGYTLHKDEAGRGE